jgi:hypothetical protein
MGIIRGFKDARAVLRAPRIQLRSELAPAHGNPQAPTSTSTITMPATNATSALAITGAMPSTTTSPVTTATNMRTASALMPRPARMGGGDAPTDEALAPIEGVAIDSYVAIMRRLAAFNHDQSMLPAIAADHGIADDAWRRAHQGWNGRIRTDPAVARRFSDIYHGVA